MTDLKMLWQQFTNKEGGEKKRRDRWMLLALFGILILVIVWPVGSKSKEADNQVSEQKKERIIMQNSILRIWNCG